MPNAVTTAIAPLLETAAAAISASVQAPVPNITTSLSGSTAAPNDLEPPDLSPAQLVYLRAICNGKGVANAAHEAGVTRRTAYRWQADPRFAAVLSVWRSQSLESARLQLLSLAEEATANVASAIHKGDVRVALALLKGLGILSPKSPGHLPVSAPSAM